MLPEPTAASKLDGRTIAVDCRWLGYGGAGRVTELLLAGLRDSPPHGRWLLWGDPERLADRVFPGAQIVPWHGHPMRLFGQADVLRVPKADLVVYLHQVRPLRPGRSATFVHDTIPLRYGGSVPVRAIKRLFMAAACRLSTRIVTVSEWSRKTIIRDLGVSPGRIVVAALGVDPVRIDRILSIRSQGERAEVALFVGRFAPHKNLSRLCRAFQRTEFLRRGGSLVLVGGTGDEVAAMSRLVESEGLRGIDVRPTSSEADLDHLLGTCRLLVQPSLEEGYGLPAVEAAAAGIPVAVSGTGYATQIPSRIATAMDPADEVSIAAAIDRAASIDTVERWDPPRSVAADVLAAVTLSLPRS